MGYHVASWEMIRTREEKLSFDEDQHIMNNMVDARACYKPSGKVSLEFWARGAFEVATARGGFRQFPIDPIAGVPSNETSGRAALRSS